jgi:hypothetical protein
VDYSLFSPTQYTKLLQHLTNTTVTSITASNEMMTGAEALQHFAGLHAFQVVHATRVVATVPIASETMNTLMASYLAVMSSNIAPVVVVASVQSTPGQWYDVFPPIMAPITLFVLIITIIACSVCWVVYCFCSCKKEEVETAVVVLPKNEPRPDNNETNNGTNGLAAKIQPNPFNGIRLINKF